MLTPSLTFQEVVLVVPQASSLQHPQSSLFLSWEEVQEAEP